MPTAADEATLIVAMWMEGVSGGVAMCRATVAVGAMRCDAMRDDEKIRRLVGSHAHRLVEATIDSGERTNNNVHTPCNQ
jgi:hypothetical protein